MNLWGRTDKENVQYCLLPSKHYSFYDHPFLWPTHVTRGPILERNWEKSFKTFPPCYSQSSLLKKFTPPPPPPAKVGWNWFFDVNIVYGKLKSENSQDYAQQPQRNCTFMNSASVPADSQTLLEAPPKHHLTTPTLHLTTCATQQPLAATCHPQQTSLQQPQPYANVPSVNNLLHPAALYQTVKTAPVPRKFATRPPTGTEKRSPANPRHTT